MDNQAGKGDSPRKVDVKKYGKNYDKIFRKPKKAEKEHTYKWPWVIRETGLLEYICIHGIGHPDYASAKRLAEEHGHEISTWLIHGCDGCCLRDDFPGRKPDDE